MSEYTKSKDDEEYDPQYEALKQSNFKQQKLSAWRPVPTLFGTTLTFTSFGVIFILIGVFVILKSNQVLETVVHYNEKCQNISVCTIEINLPERYSQPIVVLYQLDNFYQNHRNYTKSKSAKQLAGNYLSIPEIQADCEPFHLNKNIHAEYAFDGVTKLDPEAAANPCGLMAVSYFNDTFGLSQGHKRVHIKEEGIAWESDKQMKYKLPKGGEKVLWMNVTDEHFMVWMRPAALPDFRKLWGRIDEDLEPGLYTLTINNNYPSISKKNTESYQVVDKYFILSTLTVLGGKNYILGICYIGIGAVFLIMALLFFIGYSTHKKTQ